MDSATRRRLLTSVGATGLTAIAGCLSSTGYGISSDELEDIDGDVTKIKRSDQYFRVEVPRSEDEARAGLRVANQIEDSGGAVTTADQWADNTGGENWNLWIYGDFTREEVEQYLSDYDLDLGVEEREGYPRNQILGESPVEDLFSGRSSFDFDKLVDWVRPGGEFARRYELWNDLPTKLRPLNFPSMTAGRNSVILHDDVSDEKIEYLTHLLGRKGYVNIVADGVGLPESGYRPGMIVEPRAEDSGSFYFDHTELDFTEISDSEPADSSQTWQQHWNPEWEQSSTMIRISGDFGVVGLPYLVEWYQEKFNDTPTTIGLRIGEQEVTNERLGSLVDTPSEPDTYGRDDTVGWTPLPRVSADVAALLTVYLELPYEIDFGTEVQRVDSDHV